MQEPTRETAVAHALALLERTGATGRELTRARLALAPFATVATPPLGEHVEDSFIASLLRSLADARAVADRRDGLRPSGRPRERRSGLHPFFGGPNNAA